MNSSDLGQARANDWCLVSSHVNGQPMNVLFGSPEAVLGLSAGEFTMETWEAAIVGGVPSPCPWREPCESSVYLLSTSGQPAVWMESTSVSGAEGSLLVSTRPAPLVESEQLLVTARLCLGGSLLGPLAHELNNFVQGLAAAEYLFRDYIQSGDAIEIEDIDRLGEAVGDLKALGAHLQDFARVATAPVQPVKLTSIVSRAAELLSSVGRMGLVEFENTVPTDLPAFHWQHAELDFIILALVANAVDASLATKGESKVWLDATATDSAVVIDLGNSGESLDLGAHAQPGATTRSKHRHLGLGLSVALAIVARRGGSATLQPHEGEGSSLRITLPLRATEASA